MTDSRETLVQIARIAFGALTGPERVEIVKSYLDNGEKSHMGYIMCTVECAGDFALWWEPEQSGYTVDIGKAGLYSEAQASRFTTRDLFVPGHKVDELTRHVVTASEVLS